MRLQGGQTVEVRRHSYTKTEADGRGRGSTLSRTGVALARQLGAGMGPFDYVLASNVPRTVETAIAMGFAVDDTVDMGGDLWGAATQEMGDRHAHWDWGEEAFPGYAELVAADGPTAALGRLQVRLWRDLLPRLPANGTALVIAHGGLIEPGLVALRPDADHREWGRAIRHCEGARLRFDGTGAAQVELIRL
jgi:broad specificity phosphatase PhoE